MTNPTEKGRPPYFLFDPQSWSASTSIRDMSSHQVGWYIELLVSAWLSKETPQATLPNDEEVLKQKSRFHKTVEEKKRQHDEMTRSLTAALKYAGNQLTGEQAATIVGYVMGDLWDTHFSRLLREWSGVRQQFKTEGAIIYSPRQLKELNQWMEAYKRKKAGGEKGASTRWKDRQTESKPTTAVTSSEPEPLEEQEENGTPISDPFPSQTEQQQESTEYVETVKNGYPIPYPMRNIKRKTKELMDVNTQCSDSVVVNSIDEQSDTEKLVDTTAFTLVAPLSRTEINVPPKKEPKAREKLFDEEKFRINGEMASHLAAKYPEFVDGDWEWLVEKFKNVYHGKRYISFKRCFYNFVANQVSQYGYRPGNFNWRKKDDQHSGNQNHAATAPNRADQREQEAEQLAARYLQGQSAGDNQDDSEALPLTDADVR